MSTSHRPEHLPPGTSPDVAGRVATADQDVPPLGAADLVPLPPGHLACMGCGVAVPQGLEPITVEVTEVAGQPIFVDPRTGQPRAILRVALEQCADCLTREEEAVALLASSGRQDDRLALHRASLAVDALAVLGRPVPDSLSPSALRALLHHLGTQSVRWAVRFGGRLEDPADAQRCAPRPWAHVPDSTRAALRRAYLAHLDQRRAEGAPPVQVSPPPVDAAGTQPIDGGCLMCGVAAVTVKASEVAAQGGVEAASRSIWRRVEQTPRALGGIGSPDRISGHLCPNCALAVDEVGVVGLTACERALRTHLLATGREEEARQVNEEETVGLAAWGAIVHRQRTEGRRERRPNAEAWQHIRVRVP